MKATADLRSEHVGVGRMLGIMDAMSARLGAGERVAPDDLASCIEFLRVFVDQCHHAKEEQLLFPAMRAADLTDAEETIIILLGEHMRGREGAARIADAAQRIEGGAEPATSGLGEAMSDYTHLLHAHIRREENDCFDVADRGLPPAVQDELVEGYERIERDVVGEGRHEAFHALLDTLSQTYRA